MRIPTLTQKQPRKRGEYFEGLAAEFLQRQGLIILARNFACRQGEIDLICQHGPSCDINSSATLPTLVFVEVKYRQYTHYGGAVSAVPVTKQRKLRYTAQYYMVRHGINENYTPCRFDVIAIEGSIDNIQWITNAF
ncbi:YraN family protein [Moritella sp. 24]|uniref:YraN family protein n=1 Tax=Moritella sp. 24 TaxID=2746230 RepID=UPI001BAE43B5|nr:YraN family protein [Moritella sp. 24]QUM78230.1 YraN family protein [Moritella sp. 24]